ncbi:MAG: hypothetical protein ACK5JS_07900 [Mangrovibacterium sp.]
MWISLFEGHNIPLDCYKILFDHNYIHLIEDLSSYEGMTDFYFEHFEHFMKCRIAYVASTGQTNEGMRHVESNTSGTNNCTFQIEEICYGVVVEFAKSATSLLD